MLEWPERQTEAAGDYADVLFQLQKAHFSFEDTGSEREGGKLLHRMVIRTAECEGSILTTSRVVTWCVHKTVIRVSKQEGRTLRIPQDLHGGETPTPEVVFNF